MLYFLLVRQYPNEEEEYLNLKEASIVKIDVYKDET